MHGERCCAWDALPSQCGAAAAAAVSAHHDGDGAGGERQDLLHLIDSFPPALLATPPICTVGMLRAIYDVPQTLRVNSRGLDLRYSTHDIIDFFKLISLPPPSSSLLPAFICCISLSLREEACRQRMLSQVAPPPSSGRDLTVICLMVKSSQILFMR